MTDKLTDAQAAQSRRASDKGNMPAVTVQNLVKTFRRLDGTLITPVNNVSLQVQPGEMVVLLGPSGCGKTTLLRCIAGLETPDSGGIHIGATAVYDSEEKTVVPTEARNVSMVFQSYALWPHMNVMTNVAYPLRVRKVPKDATAERVRRVLGLVGIPELEKQYPGQLSGGQQQRVALARAIVSETDIILFDEPLSNVDAKVRETLRIEMATMQRELGFSGIYVTHDQEEAMELADRIVVLKDGIIEQIGAPSEVYSRPKSRYVANFVGTTNDVPGTVESIRGNRAVVKTAIGPFVIEMNTEGGELAVGDDACVTWRPESTEFVSSDLTGVNVFRATVTASMLSGPYTKSILRSSGERVLAWESGRDQLEHGVELTFHVPPEKCRAFANEGSPRRAGGGS